MAEVNPAIGERAENPLLPALRHSGATLMLRHGRLAAADFGSPTGEAAACLRAIGMADRSDRTTFSVSGAGDLDPRLAWSAAISGGLTLVRCEGVDTDACRARLEDSARDVTADFAAIGLIGPRVHKLLRVAETDNAIVLHEADDCYELLVESAAGPALWNHLRDAGRPFDIACVGLEALEHLAASRRLGHLGR